MFLNFNKTYKRVSHLWFSGIRQAAPLCTHLKYFLDTNANENVYGAVIMARVNPVHLRNADRAPDRRQP